MVVKSGCISAGDTFEDAVANAAEALAAHLARFIAARNPRRHQAWHAAV
jgi:predicted RNase H-like HicB family nuclease